MHIILLILKIIGLLLAVLLGLLVVMLAVALFVPLRYQLEGWRRQESGEMALKGRVSWFLSLIAVRFGYENAPFLQIRLLGIPWKGGRARTRESTGKREERSQTEPPNAVQMQGRVPSENIAVYPEESRSANITHEEGIHEKAAETGERRPEPVSSGLKGETAPPAVLKATSVKEPVEPEKIFGKIRNILCRLWEKLKRIPDSVRAFRERLGRIAEGLRQKKEQFDRWKAYLGSEEVKATIRLLWRQTKRLFRHIRPQRVRIRARFGFGDPALTGQITGLMSMLPAFYQKELSIQPDFSEACLEGEFFLKGRIRAASLLLLALKIWFNKDFQKVYKHLKAM